MSRRRLIVLAVIAAAFIAIIATLILSFREREPMYEGKTFSQWFAEAVAIRRSPDFLSSSWPLASDQALIAMAEPAVPHLMERLKRREGRWQRFYRECWAKLPVPIRRRCAAPGRVWVGRTVAIGLLNQMGSKATAATPELILLLEAELLATDPNFAANLISTLGHIGAEDAQLQRVLLRALTNSNSSIATSARDAFHNPNLASTTRKCLHVLIPLELQSLSQQSEAARWPHIDFLGNFGHGFPEVPPALGKVLLEEEDWRVRARAAKALRNLGPDAALARSALEHAGANDEYLNVREEAREALERLRE
jgi:hypothetical protein